MPEYRVTMDVLYEKEIIVEAQSSVDARKQAVEAVDADHYEIFRTEQINANDD